MLMQKKQAPGFGVQMKIYPTNHTDDLSPKIPRASTVNSCRTIDSCRTIWQVMHELGIQSTHVANVQKPTTNTDVAKPNLMRHLADLSGVITTDITYIHLINQTGLSRNLFVVPRSHKTK